jgi:hypothetical protein
MEAVHLTFVPEDLCPDGVVQVLAMSQLGSLSWHSAWVSSNTRRPDLPSRDLQDSGKLLDGEHIV